MYKQQFEALRKTVRFSEAWLVSSLPRSGAQIVQPAHFVGSWIKSYAREFQAEDAATWSAVVLNRPVRGEECWPAGLEQSRFFREFLASGKLRHVAAAPVEAPVFPGFAGALHVYKTAAEGDFTDAELRAVGETARHISGAAAEARSQRTPALCAQRPNWLRRPDTRQIVLDANLKSLLNSGTGDFDRLVAEGILRDARHRLRQFDDETAELERLTLLDSGGETWNFHVRAYRHYPALSSLPVVFYGLQPGYCDWVTLLATDVAADAEMTRLLPAAQFMRQEYARGPGLGEIAKTVHLSPFHFHRRFTEVLGITPKHFMLECQIFRTKQLLAAGKVELAEIAKVCGFAHQSHFTSRFRQATGLTPTRWRRAAWRGAETAADPVAGA